jgi:ectoine hydroxylase-related dioxygenase (phytanoyl-CoA dioxygenase family)
MHPAPAIDLATFARDGYLVLRRCIEPQRIAAMRAALAAEVDTVLSELHAAGKLADTRPDLPFERRLAIAGEHAASYGRGWTQRMAVPATFELHRDPALLAALHQLLGPVVHGHKQFNVRPKLPGQDLTNVPWHQDTGYYGAQTARDLIMTAWVPLVEVDARNGCMQVMPGSHRLGAVPHVDAQDAGGFLRLDTTVDEAAAVTLAMSPGDVLLMHNLVFHRSTENRSDGIRWSIDLRFWRPDTPSASDLLWGFPRPWTLSGAAPVPLEEWLGWYGR